MHSIRCITPFNRLLNGLFSILCRFLGWPVQLSSWSNCLGSWFCRLNRMFSQLDSIVFTLFTSSSLSKNSRVDSASHVDPWVASRPCKRRVLSEKGCKMSRICANISQSLVESSSSLGNGEFSLESSFNKEVKRIFEKEGSYNHTKNWIPPCFIVLNDH